MTKKLKKKKKKELEPMSRKGIDYQALLRMQLRQKNLYLSP